jgi:hypothetical protein
MLVRLFLPSLRDVLGHFVDAPAEPAIFYEAPSQSPSQTRPPARAIRTRSPAPTSAEHDRGYGPGGKRLHDQFHELRGTEPRWTGHWRNAKYL